MNVEETIKLLQVLKSNGATYFKSSDFEVTLIGGQPVLEAPVGPSSSPAEAPVEPSPIDQAATDKVVETIELLKMKDEDLANKIFPDGA